MPGVYWYIFYFRQELESSFNQWRSKGGNWGARALGPRPWGRNSTLLQSF